MGNLTIVALRTVLALALVGSLFVQAVMVPLMWIDLDEAPASVRVPVLVIVVLGILTLQVAPVCVWRLLTMVRRGTVFSDAAFRYVDIVIGAISAASLLTFALGGDPRARARRWPPGSSDSSAGSHSSSPASR